MKEMGLEPPQGRSGILGDVEIGQVRGIETRAIEPDLEFDMAEAIGPSESVEPAYITQSRFYSPNFNAAIFDGPIRIYFAQVQESQALKLYFNLQERFGETRKAARDLFKESGRNIFVMIYPNEFDFEASFCNESTSILDSAGPNEKLILRAAFGADDVIGVRGPMEDETVEDICLIVDEIVTKMKGHA